MIPAAFRRSSIVFKQRNNVNVIASFFHPLNKNRAYTSDYIQSAFTMADNIAMTSFFTVVLLNETNSLDLMKVSL